MKALAVLALLTFALLAGCSSMPPAPTVLTPQADGSYLIHMAGTRFVPANAQVPVGANVTWVNDESVGHDVTAMDGSFSSGGVANLQKGKTYTHQFTVAGTIEYHCEAHHGLGMEGVLHVG